MSDGNLDAKADGATESRRGWVDCHAHIIDPKHFVYADGPGYKPTEGEIGDAPAFTQVLARNGMSAALLVQPSCYGFDNSAMLAAIRESEGRLKGIAVVPDEISLEDMWALAERGVVGIRLNLPSFDAGFFDRPGARGLLNRCRELGWFVEVYAIGATWCDITPKLVDAGVKLVVDHFGRPDTRLDPRQRGFAAVLALARQTDALVKLSSTFRVSCEPYPHSDVDPFATALIDGFGIERCIFGTDWPFININMEQKPRYEEQLRCLQRWLPSKADLDIVLGANPKRYFGFAPSRPDAA